jgi:hypothetical protein
MLEMLGFGNVEEEDQNLPEGGGDKTPSPGGMDDQSPPVIKGDQNPSDGNDPDNSDPGGSNPSISNFYVSNTGADTNDGLTEGTAFGTLGKAYTEALADPARKRIVVLSDLVDTGLVTLTNADAAGNAILVEGRTGGLKIERSDGANDSVIEIKGGAKIAFRNITINGKINPGANEADSNNRALKITGAGTEVTLEDGAVVTGKKIGSGAYTPTEDDGSGVLVSDRAELVMTGSSRITGCEEEALYARGAVVVLSGGKLSMIAGGEISGNTALAAGESAFGGGVFLYGDSSSARCTLVMTDGAVISGNTAKTTNDSTVYGGGVSCYSYSDLTMTNAQITGNFAIGSGAGSIANGGGVYCYWSSTVTMNSGAVISGNEAKDAAENAGGGVYIHSSGSTITMNGNARISGNGASGGDSRGGGVFINTQSALVMNDSTAITGNSASGTGTGAGGGVYMHYNSGGGTLTMNNSASISANTATATTTDSLGGGVYQHGGTFTMTGGSTIAATNSADIGKTYYNPNEHSVTKPSGLGGYIVDTAIIAGVAQ